MTEQELRTFTLTSAAEAIRKKQISPVELTRAALDRISKLNDRMRAFITITGDRAMDQARSAETALGRGGQIPPLLGVPLALKDLFDTKDIRTTGGSKVFADRIPNRDATVTDRLNRAGAILVGKLNMHE